MNMYLPGNYNILYFEVDTKNIVFVIIILNLYWPQK